MTCILENRGLIEFLGVAPFRKVCIKQCMYVKQKENIQEELRF